MKKRISTVLSIILVFIIFLTFASCGPSTSPGNTGNGNNTSEQSQQNTSQSSQGSSQKMPEVWWDSFKGKLVLLHGELESDVDDLMNAIGYRNINVKNIHLEEDVKGNNATYKLGIEFIVYRNNENVIDKVKSVLSKRGYDVKISDGGHKVITTKDKATLTFAYNDTTHEASVGIGLSLSGGVSGYEWGINLAEVYGLLWHMDQFADIIEVATGGGVPENLYWGNGKSQIDIVFYDDYMEVKYMAHRDGRLNSSLANALKNKINASEHSSGGIITVEGAYGDISHIVATYDIKNGTLTLVMKSKHAGE